MRRKIKALPWKKWFLELTGILLGTAMIGVALNLFLIPNKLAAGGISGLGVVIYHLFQLPVGLTIMLGNIPLFLAGWRILGMKMVSRSILGMLALPVMVELFAFLPRPTGDLFLAAVYGGVLLGLGVWMVFRVNASTGGTALAALILNRLTGITVGQGLLWSDILIIALAGAVFGLEIAMYAAISLFVSSWVIDFIQEGFGTAKVALIISRDSREIKEHIFQVLERGVTLMPVKGGFTGDSREMIMCVVNRSQVSPLKSIVYEQDPTALMIIGNAGEALGEGFIEHEEGSRKNRKQEKHEAEQNKKE